MRSTRLAIALSCLLVLFAAPATARDLTECAKRVTYDYCEVIIDQALAVYKGNATSEAAESRSKIIEGFERMLGSSGELPAYRAASTAALDVLDQRSGGDDFGTSMLGCMGSGADNVKFVLAISQEMCRAKGLD